MKPCERRAKRGLESPAFVAHGRVQSKSPAKIFGKNTIDLQWKMRANYNARLCGGFRKSVGARTMASNGKINAQNNGSGRKSGRMMTHPRSWRHPQKIARRREASGAHIQD